MHGATRVSVVTSTGERYRGTVLGADAHTDIAVLRMDTAGRRVPQAPVVDQDSLLRVGDWVVAIGHPIGLDHTVTLGIVSSLGRSLSAPRDTQRTDNSPRWADRVRFIQTDAAINPGNSGGPLLNNQGEMVGVNVAIASKVGESSGVGFAIPVNTAKRVIPQLIENGRVIRPDIGITRVYKTEEGLLIATVAPEGPADKSGLQGFKLVKTRTQRGPFVYEQTRVDQSQADLIVAVDGQSVGSVDQFMTIVENHQPGDEIVVTVIRERQREDIKVVLGGE